MWKEDVSFEGFFAFTTYRVNDTVRITLDHRIDVAQRFPDMKTAIHKADELRKAGYETQTLLIL